MTFRPRNKRGRGRTNYHAVRILIPHRPEVRWLNGLRRQVAYVIRMPH